MVSTVVNWEGQVHLTWVEASQPPKQVENVTSVHGFCFDDSRLLLIDLNDRGWDIPGGHMEPGERPEESFAREAMEEGYVEGDFSLLGYIIVDHSHNENWNERSKYPLIGYQLFFKMNITKVHSFAGEFESSRRLFIQPNQMKQFYSGWHDLYQEILTCAIKKEGENHMRIRKYERKDRQHVIALAERFNATSHTNYRDQAKMEAKQRELALKAVGENTDNIFVAENEGVFLGYIELTIQEDYFTNKKQAYVSAVAVAPQGEGRGIGKALMNKAEEWAKSQDLTEVVLDVFKTNERAIGLYEHIGYQQEIVKMVKEL